MVCLAQEDFAFKTSTRSRKKQKKSAKKPWPDNIFPKGKTIEELAKEQGVGPLWDPKVLQIPGWFPEGEDIDAFLEEIYSSRR